MNAVISGRAGRALLMDRDSLSSFEHDDPSNVVPRKRWELAYLFGEAHDLRIVENTDIESVKRELRLDCTFNAALDLTLIVLDGDLHRDIRKKAVESLDVLLEDHQILERLENILYARPLSEDGDLQGALKLGDQPGLTRSYSLLETLAESQPLIAEVSEAWDAIPAEYFGSYDQQDEFQRVAAREGLFRELVLIKTLGHSVEYFLVSAERSNSITSLPRHQKVLTRWIAPLLRHSGVAEQVLETVNYETPSTPQTPSILTGTSQDSWLWVPAIELPRILLVGTDHRMAGILEQNLINAGYAVDTIFSSAEALMIAARGNHAVVFCDLPLPDIDSVEFARLLKSSNPRMEIIAATTDSSSSMAVESSRSVSFFLTKPFDLDELRPLINKALRRVVVKDTPREAPGAAKQFNLIGTSKQMQTLYETIEAVAKIDANVLIVGESGSGKEVIANAIHYNSHRSGKPFIKVNFSAIPRELIENELFGHKKAAFTGAVRDTEGLIHDAKSGSLMFDEIEAIPVELQGKLLRVLQDRSYRKIGSERKETADFRLICSISKPPGNAIREGLLRQDLVYRMSTVILEVPPLRERNEDIPLLTEHFLRMYSLKYSRTILGVSPAAYQRLLDHSWPGNVRELRNVIERAVLLTSTNEIKPEDLPFENATLSEKTSAHYDRQHIPAGMTLEEIERLVIERALKRTGGNQQAAANLLGIYRRRLYNKIRKHNIDVKDLLST